MKTLFIKIAVVASLWVAACSPRVQQTGSTASSGMVADGKLWSSLFQQKSAEYQALCLQAFNLAQLRVDQALQQSHSKPLAIITDIDETFLDNSPYAVHRALQGKDYSPETWYQWTAKGIADTLTGGLAFFKYAAAKNVTIFYITNRDEQERAGTLANLQRFGFPNADNQHLILRQGSSSKETRRQQVAQTHDIILLLGDNLSDFSLLFDKQSTAQRAANVQQLKNEFGKKFIVLPNANYGGWEDAIYGNTHSLTPAQKDSAIKANLSGY
jgi:5'-nucleotidase (lipoprotein e(P4) family)